MQALVDAAVMVKAMVIPRVECATALESSYSFSVQNRVYSVYKDSMYAR